LDDQHLILLFACADWKTITILYCQLLKINPNPIVDLNYAIASYYGGQRNEALVILHRLEAELFSNSIISCTPASEEFILQKAILHWQKNI
jgi:predicted RNA polymerase sigma factor